MKQSRTVRSPSVSRRNRKHRRQGSVDRLDVSERLSSIRPQDQQQSVPESGFLAAFKPQTYDSIGMPAAPNDTYDSNNKAQLADLERALSYGGGWTQYNQIGGMTYGIVPDCDLSHSNMMPHFSTRNGYGSNDLWNADVVDYKNQLFTGNIRDTWNHRKEVGSMFAPMGSMHHPYGTPVMEESERDRYVPGQYHQGASSITKQQVTPGLGLGANEVGTHGFHSDYRVLGKTLEDLRVNPKVTLEGRIIEGQRGTNRPVQAPVVSYRPQTFKTTTTDDLLPTSSTIDAPKTRDNFIMKEPDRANQHCEYTGAAYTSQEAVQQNVPEHMRPLIKNSEKTSYTLPKPLQKFSKAEAHYNPDLSSYDTTATLKDLTIDHNRAGLASNPTQTYVASTAPLQTTLKEITASTPQPIANTRSNTMQGTVHPLEATRTTLKETLVDNPLNPHINQGSSLHRVYYNDIARTTMRETTQGPIDPANISQSTATYTSITDPLRTTTRETTVGIPINTHLQATTGSLQTIHPSDTPQTTLKETTIELPRSTHITQIGGSQQALYSTDGPRSTLKETTSSLPRSTFTNAQIYQGTSHTHDAPRSTMKETLIDKPQFSTLTMAGGSLHVAHPCDAPQTTLKETTIALPRQSYVIPIGQQQRAPDPQDTPRTTLKEVTTSTPRPQGPITTMGGSQQGLYSTDPTRTTLRETTVQTPWQTNLSAVNQQQSALHPLDGPRSTLKETTIELNRSQFITPASGSLQTLHPSDAPRSTLKETTIELPRSTVITQIGGAQQALYSTDGPRSTLKETTIELPRSTHLTQIGGGQQALYSTDGPRSTLRETTIELPRSQFVTPINQQQAALYSTDPARTTLRETTVALPRSTYMNPATGSLGKVYSSDGPRTTLKETVISIPYQTTITGAGVAHGPTFNPTPLRTTLKETTVTIPYSTTLTATGQQQGSASTFDRVPLRTTLKEQTAEKPTQTFASSTTGSKHMVGSTDPLRTTIKETTATQPRSTFVKSAVGGPYTAPQDVARTTIKETTVHAKDGSHAVAIGQQQGSASTYSRTPLQTTVKETTIDNDRTGSVSQDITGKGYGYLTEKPEAINTNRQFTGQEVYITPLKGINRERSYAAAYHAPINNRREQVLQYHEPTPSNINLGPDVASMNPQLRDDNTGPSTSHVSYTYNADLDRLRSQHTAKCAPQQDAQRFIDPVLLQQLSNNPFNLSITGGI